MIKALRGKIVVLPNEKIQETESGLTVVGNYNPELGLRRGKIISVGKGCDPVLQEGGEACYMAFSGVPMHHEGVRYLMLPEIEVVGISV